MKSVADQVIRCASSAPANLAEGDCQIGRDRAPFWGIAYASAKKGDSHLKLLVYTGVVDAKKVEGVLETFDEGLAVTWSLLHSRE
jgi:four helix bundle protein